MSERFGARFRNAVAVVLVLPAIFACRPLDEVVGGPAEDRPAKGDVCASVDGKTYCFDRELVYVLGDDGFLLQLPLNELNHECNRDRKLYPFVHVLFSSGSPPPVENFRNERADQRIRVVEPKDFFFRNSSLETEVCESAPGRGVMLCQRRSHWGTARLDFGYDEQCASQARRYAQNLESFIERGAR
jgi:hypothetical protein